MINSIINYTMIYLIVGLGNIGKQYEHTRHNVGFDVVDKLAESWGQNIEKEGFKGTYLKLKYFDKDVIILKPSTFMNLSGDSIKACMDFYKIPKENLIVIHDDMDIPIGHLKLKEKGSSGGHNGIKSIIANLGGNEEFKRIRVGIGHPENHNVIDFVLTKFSKEERDTVDEAIKNAVDAIKMALKESFNKAMTIYNR